MARRNSLFAGYAQMQREAARAQAAQIRAQAAARREAERAHAAYQRALAAEEKERRRLYAESRAAHVAAMNSDLEATVGALEGLLAASLQAGDLVRFSSLKKPASPPPWRHAELERPEPAPALEAFMPAPPAGLAKVFGKAKHEQAVAEGRARYEQAVDVHRRREEQRSLALAHARADWQAAVDATNAAARMQHGKIDAFEADYRRGDLDAVVSYCSLVLEASVYPDRFPQKFQFAYVPDSRQAVVEYELPTVDVVPAVRAYKYVKTSDTISESARPQFQIRALYASVVAQVAIRTLHELLVSDKAGYIDTVVFNGIVDTTDPGSGRPIRPCLVTVRATRDSFGELDLAHVEPLACLKHLSAGYRRARPSFCQCVRCSSSAWWIPGSSPKATHFLNSTSAPISWTCRSSNSRP
jgi:restriction system protein